MSAAGIGSNAPERPASRSRPLGAVVLVAALLVAAAALAIVAARGPSGDGGMDERVRAVASGLRCPVCQNLSVADSPSRLAQQMRSTIGRELQAGRSPERIRSEFVAAYGDWILLSPPRHGVDLIAWIVPVVLVLAGLGTAVFAIRRWTLGGRMQPDSSLATGGPSPAAGGPSITGEDRALLRRATDDFEDRPE